MNKEFKNHKSVYETPTMDTIGLVQMMTVCSSNGTTQNYSSESIWGQGTDNE